MQDEEITEDDLRLIHERESSIRQLEVSFVWPLGGSCVLSVFVTILGEGLGKKTKCISVGVFLTNENNSLLKNKSL